MIIIYLFVEFLFITYIIFREFPTFKKFFKKNPRFLRKLLTLTLSNVKYRLEGVFLVKFKFNTFTKLQTRKS